MMVMTIVGLYMCIHGMLLETSLYPFCYQTASQVKGVMRQNINKVAERGERLEDLGERAGGWQ